MPSDRFSKNLLTCYPKDTNYDTTTEQWSASRKTSRKGVLNTSHITSHEKNWTRWWYLMFHKERESDRHIDKSWDVLPTAEVLRDSDWTSRIQGTEAQQTRMDWNELEWIHIFKNIDSRMLKWMLFNPEFLFIYRNCIEHISMPFNLKILVCTFSVHTHFVNTI